MRACEDAVRPTELAGTQLALLAEVDIATVFDEDTLDASDRRSATGSWEQGLRRQGDTGEGAAPVFSYGSGIAHPAISRVDIKPSIWLFLCVMKLKAALPTVTDIAFHGF